MTDRVAGSDSASSATAWSGNPGARLTLSSACDACKRRKIKCVGGQPCERCKSSQISCTYGSRPARDNTIAYARHLEAKVAELQSLLHQQPLITPDNIDFVEQSRSKARDDLIQTLVGPGDDHIYLTPQDDTDSFHGKFAGLTVLRTIRELAGQIAKLPSNQYGKTLAEAFDSGRLSMGSWSGDPLASFALLPSRRLLRETISTALDEALSCQECLDRDELERKVSRLYTCDPEDYTTDDRRALALVYALMALGRQRELAEEVDQVEPGVVVLRGISYFRASRTILDTLDCNCLDSICTIICLANYLLSASMASKAYTFICMGISAALRMGLHTYSSAMREAFTPRELTLRRRAFAVLNCNQIYISSVLGMPLLLRQPDMEQVVAVPEECLHDQGRQFVQIDPVSPNATTLLLCQLFQITAKVIRNYEAIGTSDATSDDKISLSTSSIVEWEAELKSWSESLPQVSPGSLGRDVLRAQLILRFVAAAVRITIYRPFVDHVVRSQQDSNFNQQGVEFGSSCLQASMQAIWLADTMDTHDLLHPAQWYVVYNLAIAASSLMLYELGESNDTVVGDTKAASAKATELITKLGGQSVSAKRCSESLGSLQNVISHSRDPSGSPKTRFMRAIGAYGENTSSLPSSGSWDGN